MFQIDTEKLILERANQGMSITALAKKSTVSRKTITNIEQGLIPGKYDTLGKLAKALGKDLAYFKKVQTGE